MQKKAEPIELTIDCYKLTCVRGNRIDQTELYIPPPIVEKLLRKGLVPHSYNDKPAVLYGSVQCWFSHGTVHRNHRPAILMNNGDISLYVRSGERHRWEGPAFQSSLAATWYFFGRMHRYDGPAKEFPTRDSENFLHGVELKKKDFKKLTANRTPVEITTEFVRRLDDFVDEYDKRAVTEHALRCLKHYKAPEKLTKAIEGAIAFL